jgi:hypothetical protein
VFDALSYSANHLWPLEQSEGASWRRNRTEDGDAAFAKNKQWKEYRTFAIAVGLDARENGGVESVEGLSSAIERLQARLEAGSHTSLLKALRSEQRSLSPPLLTPHADALAATVFSSPLFVET